MMPDIQHPVEEDPTMASTLTTTMLRNHAARTTLDSVTINTTTAASRCTALLSVTKDIFQTVIALLGATLTI